MNKFMRSAIKEAQKGIHKGHGGPFGAVIVKDGKVVARGHNQVVKNNDPTCHGEMQAIRAASKKLGTFDLSGCDIYTTGEPCPMCMGAILWANIGKVYYGCNIDDTEKIGFRDSVFYQMQEEGMGDKVLELDRKACLKLYEEYLAINDRTNY
ncbi:MAG: nucleoside deaminase [Bacilli bacterium]|jgi:guanine deaminase